MASKKRRLRLSFARSWLRASPTDNGYARPIEGVIAVVDLSKKKVIRVDDHGVVPMPPNDGNYAAEFIKNFREDLKPLDIVQPEGPSFKVEGNEVSWQKWSFRVGFTRREGLVLHGIAYEDQGRKRPIIYRASLAELVVPYGDPEEQNFRKNAFDVGEVGIGILANPLTLGCDCLGQIYYFDAVLNDSFGGPVHIPTLCACTRKTSASFGSIPTGAPDRLRCAVPGAWSSHSSPPSATMSTASSGTCTKTVLLSSK